MEREIARLLLDKKAVTLRTDPPYTWSSGMLAPIYTDNRILMSHPAERRVVVDHLVRAIAGCGSPADVIAGVCTSGIPWAAWVAERMGKPMIYVRSASKGYGQDKLIEGSLKKGDNAMVIEDLISTGGSSVGVVKAIRDAGGVVGCCIAIFTYGLAKAEKAFSEAGCRAIALTDFDTLVSVASETGRIRSDELASIMAWSKDPEGWGRPGALNPQQRQHAKA